MVLVVIVRTVRQVQQLMVVPDRRRRLRAAAARHCAHRGRLLRARLRAVQLLAAVGASGIGKLKQESVLSAYISLRFHIRVANKISESHFME